MIRTLTRHVNDVFGWLGQGFATVIPEAFIVAAAAVAIVAWMLLSRRYQRCPHCRRVVRRVKAGSLRCSRCGRQYYHGLRHVG